MLIQSHSKNCKFRFIKPIIKYIPVKDNETAVSIFAEAFCDDPLFVLAFHDLNNRLQHTKIVYDFVVKDMVPELKLKFKGAYINGELTGCIVFDTPDSREWNEKLNIAVERMHNKANVESIFKIGEFARLNTYKAGVPVCFGYEIAVSKTYQGKGIGTMLISNMINECKRYREVKGIQIDTANEKNLPLYNKLGFELMHTEIFYSIKKFFLFKQF